MADENDKLAKGNTAAKKTTKSVKKKTVKKAVKKSVKKKTVKKAVKKAAKKKTASPAVTKEVAPAAAAISQKEEPRAGIRLKASPSTPGYTRPNQKKDGLASLSRISITLLIIIGIWAFVSYLNDDESTEDKTAPGATTTDVTPAAMPKAMTKIMPKVMPMEMAPAATAPVAPADDNADGKTEENKGFFGSLFSSEEETAEASDSAVSEPAVKQMPRSAQNPMQRPMPYGPYGPYGQPDPWGPPQGFDQPQYGAPFNPAMQPMPWGPPQGFGPTQGFGPAQGFGPPPGFYDMPPPMPKFDQGMGW